MQHMFGKRRWKLSLGLFVSVALHLGFVALFMLRLPEPYPAAQEESIAVELTPPPEEEELSEKPDDPPSDDPLPEPAAENPIEAFESASPQEVEAPQADTPASGMPSEAPEEEQTSRTEPDEAQKQEDAQAPASEPGENNTEETSAAPDELSPSASASVEEDTQQEMEEAQTLYSEATLSNPRVQEALGRLPPDRRLVQICSIEALEQVRHSVSGSFPDMLVPYSTGGGLISGRVLNASGGAYRSLGRWYAIDFRCEVDEEARKLVSFRYEVGPAIPQNEWESRRLPSGS